MLRRESIHICNEGISHAVSHVCVACVCCIGTRGGVSSRRVGRARVVRASRPRPRRAKNGNVSVLGPAVGKKLLRDKKKPRKQRHGSPRRTSRAHPHDDCNPSPHPHLNMPLAATSSRVVVRLPTLARVARKSGTRAVTTTRASSAETVRKLLPEKPPDFFSSFATRSASSDLAARARLTRRVDRGAAPMRAPRA